MTTRGTRRPRATAAAAGVVGLLAALLSVAAGGTATAEPATLKQTYQCVFPLIEEDPVTVDISVDLPTEVRVGETIPAQPVVSVSKVTKRAADGLATVGSATLEGTAKAYVTVGFPDGPLDIGLTNTLEKTTIPSPSADFDVKANGKTPDLSFDQPGEVPISVNSLLLTLTPKDAAGNKTSLDTFESECHLDPADQNKILHTIKVVPGSTESTENEDATEPTDPTESTQPTESTEPTESGGGGIPYNFNLKGNSFIKAANGNTPLSGSINTLYDLDKGTFTADLKLNPTTGSFSILGFLPTQTDIKFVQTAKTTGTLDETGTMASHSEMDVYLTSVRPFGIPIGGGEKCKTTEPSKIDLKGTNFVPNKGGKLTTASYKLAGLNDQCGMLGGIISAFMAGDGNTIDMDLTYKK
ncbi:hypothetical protein G5C51_19060 [Streptomyces sp. A7024]|uniref:DUF6801 domain-containing protein n=1 Tax=Streptomyces coryli TaxID=1128680 RepID=A0A6G4U1F7_9ACTN|nr:DUF6801 domain-containing protein [Streptomyces coryli]NGN65984.1 hypothetical protein [Streptomyces coryli]